MCYMEYIPFRHALRVGGGKTTQNVWIKYLFIFLKLHSLFQVNLRIYYFNNFTTNSSGTWNAMNRVLAFDIFVSIVCQVNSPFLHSNWCNEDDEEEVPVDPPKTTRLVSHDTIWWAASGSGRGGPKRRYCWLEVKWWQRWDAAYLESIH